MGTRASDIIAYVDAASSFGMKIRIEKVRGNRVEQWFPTGVPRHQRVP